MSLEAVILAGRSGGTPTTAHHWGPASRLMLPILDRPAIDPLLRSLRHHGILDVTIQLDRATPALEGYVGDGRRYGARLRYASGPAVWRSPVRDAAPATTCLVLPVGILPEMDLSTLIARHEAQRAAATVLAGRRPLRSTPYGCRERAVGWILAPAALERLHDRTARRDTHSTDAPTPDTVPSGRAADATGLHDLIADLMAAGEMVDVIDGGDDAAPFSYLDLATTNGYYEVLCRAIAGTLPHYSPPGRVVAPGIRVHASATCERASTAMSPPVIIDAEATVATGAQLIGPVAVLRGARIESGARVSGSIIGPYTQVEAGAHIHARIVNGDHQIAVDREQVEHGNSATRWLEPDAAGPDTLLGRAIREQELRDRPDRAA